MKTIAHGPGEVDDRPGAPHGTIIDERADLDARESAIREVGAQIADGTYDPPLEEVVDSLVVALAPVVRLGR